MLDLELELVLAFLVILQIVILSIHCKGYWKPIYTLEEMRSVMRQDVLLRMRHSPNEPYTDFHSMGAFWLKKGELDQFSSITKADNIYAPEDAMVLVEHITPKSPIRTFITMRFGKGRFRLPQDSKECGGRYTEVEMYIMDSNLTRLKAKVKHWLSRE
jgi:hypothetical protein